ncbi:MULTISPECIES: tetratricopeptide repeat protein [Rhodovulum]|uniref:Ancillary SecYEG translocon subunit/Cell division coordinator CpoB TPR domain-containing protein n=2 Tax=Rhodovulum TaxID=34008 RepID=A0A8E2VJI6_9RHOB|nr:MULTISPECIES: tetratricopeptide repeat protein [Rhodovulum]PTW49803.1 hypothetical protein C8N38_10664 [Rhodovulum kholense]RAP41349.1 hypothetical protein BYZ73_10395 [Rhodovulum viride]
MTNPDSFIQEVTDEVRRDRLFAWMRRYGWLAALIIVGLVGAAAWREWSIARQEAAAQALGDSILDAIEIRDAAARAEALGRIGADGPAGALVALLAAAEAPDAAGRIAATERLDAIAADASLPPYLSDLAALKLVLMRGSDMAPEARLAALEPLAAPGRPFRTLALEQMAYAEIDADRTEAALDRLRGLLDDAEASADLRQRASRLIVALGGSPDAG